MPSGNHLVPSLTRQEPRRLGPSLPSRDGAAPAHGPDTQAVLGPGSDPPRRAGWGVLIHLAFLPRRGQEACPVTPWKPVLGHKHPALACSGGLSLHSQGPVVISGRVALFSLGAWRWGDTEAPGFRLFYRSPHNPAPCAEVPEVRALHRGAPEVCGG